MFHAEGCFVGVHLDAQLPETGSQFTGREVGCFIHDMVDDRSGQGDRKVGRDAIEHRGAAHVDRPGRQGLEHLRDATVEFDGTRQLTLCRPSCEVQRHPDFSLGVEARLLEGFVLPENLDEGHHVGVHGCLKVRGKPLVGSQHRDEVVSRQRPDIDRCHERSQYRTRRHLVQSWWNGFRRVAGYRPHAPVGVRVDPRSGRVP